ncbi:MAG TPA: hypothetical protein VEG68_08555 [Terriglobales bacterium]|nr:hypothetical protein [Terriglobales bacterium]
MPDDSNLALYASLEEAVHSASADVLKAAAADPGLSEDLALALLKRSDLPAEVLEQISKNAAVIKARKAKLAIVGHPRTPRHVSLALLRQLFTFDLMKVALTPAIPGDVRAAAEEALIKRLESLSSGEKMSLARRASGRVVGALLLDPEIRVIHAAQENPRLTEALVIKALMRTGSSAALVRAVCEHAKWSLRREIRVALLQNEKTPPKFAEEFAKALPVALLTTILQSSRLPEAVKSRWLRQD